MNKKLFQILLLAEEIINKYTNMLLHIFVLYHN